MSLTSSDLRRYPRVAPDPHGRLTSSEVASRLRISVSSVTRAPRNLLPYAETPGGHRRYEPDDVDRYQRHLEGSQTLDQGDAADDESGA